MATVRTRRRGTPALLAAVAAISAACGDPTGSGTAAPPSPAASPTGRDAARMVCAEFTSTALGVDSTVDRGPADARRRATARFGTAELATTLQGQGRDDTWPTLVLHEARVAVTTEPVLDDPPRRRGNQIGAAVTAQRVATGPHGWRQKLPSLVVYCSLVDDGTTWRVSSVTMSSTGHSG